MLRPAAYAFVARLAPDRTVEEIWKVCLALDPDGAPGQTEVLQLLAQLHAADNLSAHPGVHGRQPRHCGLERCRQFMSLSQSKYQPGHAVELSTIFWQAERASS